MGILSVIKTRLREVEKLEKNIPLYKQIEEAFINQIEVGKLKEGDRIPSEIEITKLFHVSQITAKNALNNLAEKGYVERVRGKGTFVKFEDAKKKEHVIGIIFTTMQTYIDKELLNELEHCARKEGLRFFFGLSRESIHEEVRLIDYFVECGVEGLVIFPAESENFNDDILKLHVEKFPLVLIDRYFNKLGISSVSSDNFSGGYQLTDLAIKSGFSKLSLITTIEENSATIDRIKGIEQAFVANNIPINKNLWLSVPSTITDNQEIIGFLSIQRPNSVIAVNAHLSQLISDYAKNNGIFHLSFDNPVGCNHYVKQDTKKIASETIRILKKAITEKEQRPTLVNVPVKIQSGILKL